MQVLGPFSPLAAYLALSRGEAEHYTYNEGRLSESEQKIVTSSLRTILEEARKFYNVSKYL